MTDFGGATNPRAKRAADKEPVHLAPFALATDGSLLLNVALMSIDNNLDVIVELAKNQEVPISVGVAVSSAEMKRALHDLDDSVAEIAARIGGHRT